MKMPRLVLMLRLPRRMTAAPPTLPQGWSGVVERPAPRSRGHSARPVPPAHSGPGQGLRAAMGPAATTHPEG